MAVLLQLLTGALGSAGFGLIFHIRYRLLPLAAMGGFLSWLIYLAAAGQFSDVFFPALVAGCAADIYAEVLARILGETSTSIFVLSVIPLIPGSTLYYCMRSIIEHEISQAIVYGRDTFLCALGIAAGMSIAWSVCYFQRKITKRIKV